MFNNDIKRTIGKTLKTDGYKLAPPLGKGAVYYAHGCPNEICQQADGHPARE